VIVIKSEEEIAKIAHACRIVGETFAYLKDFIKPDITTKELEKKAEDYIVRAGGVPAFKGYRGYPASICTSVNNQVVHGIPSGNRLQEGDIVSIDLGVSVEGFYGDAAFTFPVGTVGREAERLMKVTEEALWVGIEATRAGARVSDVGSAIQKHVEASGFSVVRTFVGHGIGKNLHEEPQVPNYGTPGRGVRLREGMTLAIEPMVNAGGYDVKVLDDGWTAVTSDGSLSAHFEHTVVIQEDGARVLTGTA
jgi:methionyl aminopeptidase